MSVRDRPTAPKAGRFTVGAGLTLAFDDWGGDGPLAVLLHGGGQTRHAWGGTGSALASAGWRALAVDLRGHGESDWAENGHYSVDTMADDIADLIAQHDGPAVLIGASLGGLVSLTLAARQPDRCRALVLVDVTPRLEPTGAARIVGFMTSRPDGFANLDEAADAVAAYASNRPKPPDTRGLEKNLRLGPDGRWRWHWDPRFLEGVRAANDQSLSVDPTPMLKRARAVTAPTLLVRGRLSDVVSEESVAEFREAVPHASVVDVSGAGHMVAGDRNDAFTSAVLDFLERHSPR